MRVNQQCSVIGLLALAGLGAAGCREDAPMVRSPSSVPSAAVAPSPQTPPRQPLAEAVPARPAVPPDGPTTAPPPRLGPVSAAERGAIAAPLLTSRSTPPRTANPIPDGKDAWKACDAALDWIVRHQAADGSWHATKPGATCTDSRCADRPGHASVVGDTALAILAIGATGWGDSRVAAFLAGIEYLCSVQATDGSFAAQGAGRRVLDQALATESLCRFIDEKSKDAHRDAARRAATRLLSMRTPGAAWSLGGGFGESCDLRATTWASMALADARLAGVEVADDVYRDVLRWLETDPGGPTVRAATMRICCRVFCGTTQRDPRLLADLDVVRRDDERPEEEREPLDAASRYLATVAGFYCGGESWRRRSQANADELPRQHGKDAACRMGSWDPVAPAEPDGDRIGATALTSMLFDSAYISTYRNVMWARSFLPE